MSNNPLDKIFLESSSGKISEELDNINNIELFFKFIIDDNIEDKEKEIVLKDLTSKLKVNRYISEFFSSYENKSIYIYLFDLYIKNKTTKELKEAIISLIEELLYNIQTGKDIYDYIFQKMAQIYRGEIPAIESNLYNYLKLLNTLFSEIDSRPPKNYMACSGHCQFGVDFSNTPLEVGHSFSLNLNFRISSYDGDMKNPEKNRIASLVKIFFTNQKSISIDLQYPFQLIVKEIRKEYIKTLPIDEWINLVITIINPNNKDIQVNFFVNGENNVTAYKVEKFGLKSDTHIQYIDFFNGFYGQVSSIFMYSQKEKETPLANNSNYLSQLKNYIEGIWKKKKIEEFLRTIQKYESGSKMPQSSNNNLSGNLKDTERKKNLLDYLVFLFTPIHYNKKYPNIIEDALFKYKLKFSGNIRVHKYQSYQKQLELIGGFSNFYPIAEMFLIYPEILTEKNFEIFLQIIGNILNYRKHNLEIVNKSKLFKILSMFMEKYPNRVYTENILNEFFSLAKILFMNNLETECYNYFNYILLNEKILSKYNEKLQIIFWNKLFLFCQSDITQIQTLLNMNRLCLILRFYDRNKYQEMCCQEHLDVIKKQYTGSIKVMNPTMKEKLSQLKDIMNLIIDSSESNNAISFFKLLTLDLSPCLIKFIIDIFIKAFDKQKINEDWKKSFIDKLIDAKYEVIIFNTFMHALPDVRYKLLNFINQIHNKLVLYDKIINIKTLEGMLKTCLLPEKMFFHKKIKLQEKSNKDISKEKKENKKAVLNKKNEEKKVENINIYEIKCDNIDENNLKDIKGKQESKKVNETKEPKENIKIETEKKNEDKKIIPEEKIKKEQKKKQEKKEDGGEEKNKKKDLDKNEKNVEKKDKKEITKKPKEKNEEQKEGKKDEKENTKKPKEKPKEKKEDKKDEKPKEKKEDKKESKKEEKKEENKIESKGIKNKEESKKDSPKKEPLKKKDPKNPTSSNIKENTKKPPLKSQKKDINQEKNPTTELKHQKTLPIKEDNSNSSNPTRQNFLALISKFNKPQAEPTNKEPVKAPMKLISKDNPFIKKQEEEKKKKEQEKKEKEKIEKEKKEKRKKRERKNRKRKIRKRKNRK